MKRMRCIMICILLVLSMTACVAKPDIGTTDATEQSIQPSEESVQETIQEESELQSPPDLTVTAGMDSFVITSGNCSWVARGQAGEMGAFVACGAHPLDDIRDHEFRVIDRNSAELSFPATPNVMVVRRWPASDLGNPDAEGETVSLDNFTLAIEAGQWVYEIKATWDRDTWGGEASYHLYVSR